MADFLSKENRRKHSLAAAVMATLSLAWIADSIVSYCVLVASVYVQGRSGGQYYQYLSYRVPTVSGELALGALIAFPISTFMGLLVGWTYFHDGNYQPAIGFNLTPTLNLLALWIGEA